MNQCANPLLTMTLNNNFGCQSSQYINQKQGNILTFKQKNYSHCGINQLEKKNFSRQRRIQIEWILKIQNNYKLRFQGMSRLNKQQIRLLTAILRSKKFFDYLEARHGIKENHLIQNKSIEEEIISCQQYFQEQEFIVIDQITIKTQTLIGLSLPNQWIMISSQCLQQDVSSLLLLLHLYFQINIGSYEITLSKFVEQQQCFYSELWSFQFVPGLFEGTLLKELNTVDFWKMNSFDCAMKISNSQKQNQKYLPVNQFLEHNQTTKLILKHIKSILSDIIDLPLNDLYTKYQVDGQNKPRLHRYYSNLSYWYSLYLQIQLSALDKWRVLCIKAYNIRVRQKNFLLYILDVMLSTEKEELYLILEQVFFWLFQYQLQSSIDFIISFTLSCIHQPLDSYIISLQDRMLIETIIKSEAMRKAVLEINTINQRQLNEMDLQAKYDELMEFLRTTKVIRYQDSTIFGIRLMSGRIGLSAIQCFDEQNSIRKRALRIITIIHQVFAHKKRREYVYPENILELYPFQWKYFNTIKPKARFYPEIQVLGVPIQITNDQQAEFILNPSSWQLKEANFLSTYKQLSEAQPQQQVQILQQQNQQIRKSTRCIVRQ